MVEPFWRYAWNKVLVLSSGTAIAQAITVIASLLLTAFYTPADFGILGMITAMTMVAVVGANGGYEYSIMLPHSEEEASNLWWLCEGINVVYTLIALVIVSLLGYILLYFSINYSPYIGFWGLFLWAEGAAQPLRTWHNRKRNYRLLSVAKIGQNALTVGLSLIPWGGTYTWDDLLWAYSGGQMVYLLILYHDAPFFPSLSLASLHAMKSLSQRYKDFPLYAVAGGWLNTFLAQLPYLFLPMIYDKTVVGYYHIAQKVLSPFSIIGKAIADIFYEQASQSYKQGMESLKRLCRETFKMTALVGLLPMVVGIFLLPWLFRMVLGETWYLSGKIAAILLPSAYIGLITIPLSFVFDVTRTLRLFLVYTLCITPIHLACFWIVYAFLPIEEGIALISATGIASMLIQWLFVGRILKKREAL